MADYRDISQEYARQGINAGILLNGGAAVALLSQVGSLNEQHLTDAIRWPMSIWAAGAVLAAFGWLMGFASSRFVDKSEREGSMEVHHVKAANFGYSSRMVETDGYSSSSQMGRMVERPDGDSVVPRHFPSP